MLAPPFICGKLLILCPIGIADGLAETLPLFIVIDSNRHPVIIAIAAVDAAGCAMKVTVPDRSMYPPIHSVVYVRLGKLDHDGLGGSHIDELPFARTSAVA